MTALAFLGGFDVPGLPAEVAKARGFVRKLLGHDHPAVDDVVLLVSETVTNAITFSDSGATDSDGNPLGTVAVVLRGGDHVIRVEVVDEGANGRRPEPRGDLLAENGHGLWLITAIAARYGYRQNTAGTTFWFEVDF